MNSNQKFLVNLEVCRSLLAGVKSDRAASTIMWMCEEIDTLMNKFIQIKSLSQDVARASAFISKNKQAIKGCVPEPVPALFLVSCVTQLLGDLEKTQKYKYIEALVEGSYALEEHAEKDSYEIRRQASNFVENLQCLMGT